DPFEGILRVGPGAAVRSVIDASRRTRHATALACLVAASFFISADERPPRSDHFDGSRFVNPEPLPIGFFDWVNREFTKKRGPWRTFTPIVPAACPEARVEDGRLRVTWINHATVLVQIDGLNVLTDPTWAERSFPTVGPKRRRPPGLAFEDLPPIDVVL